MQKEKSRIQLFGKVKTLCACALLAGAAVAIGYVCRFLTVGSLRLTFENLPIILSGVFFGPAAGLITGITSDLVSTALSQYGIGGINPIITLGAGAIGLAAGLVGKASDGKAPGALRLGAAVGAAHFAGNIIIKSAGLMIYYNYALPAVLPRIPLYLFIGSVEYVLALLIIKSKGIRKAAEALK